MSYTEVSTKDVAAIVRAAFPAYRKKACAIQTATSVTFQDVNWSGGTKNEYVAVALETLRAQARNMAVDMPHLNPFEGKTVDIPPGVVVVRAGFFCGQPSRATIYTHPDDMARLITA
jgi:hypothetical protein